MQYGEEVRDTRIDRLNRALATITPIPAPGAPMGYMMWVEAAIWACIAIVVWYSLS